jgi:hypothetical protein
VSIHRYFFQYKNYVFTFEIGSGTGESGIGRSATAGIACGIVFSAVIFTAEIVFFKFCYSASNGFGRSAAYLA